MTKKDCKTCGQKKEEPKPKKKRPVTEFRSVVTPHLEDLYTEVSALLNDGWEIKGFTSSDRGYTTILTRVQENENTD